jgi:hypothetical protein
MKEKSKQGGVNMGENSFTCYYRNPPPHPTQPYPTPPPAEVEENMSFRKKIADAFLFN